MKSLAALMPLVLCGMVAASPLHAQHSHGEPKTKQPDHVHDHGSHEHMGHDMGEHGAMPSMYGKYPMSREASGTAWQPESAPHEGLHFMKGDWMIMLHGFATPFYTHQGGERGDDKIVAANMLMGMATRGLGPGRLGLRSMLSAEPWTAGKKGYPLLLQTGETADGLTHLIDRQHPHDLFMELAATYSVADDTRSAFLYLGLPGEPALGPPAFMHRFSGVEIPESPIGHHWLDSTHITYGVATLGLVKGGWKLEASRFTGREPDQDRTDIESPDLDSHSFRVSYNPAAQWSFQASVGRIHSPEQLEPEVDTDRWTASAMYHRGAEIRNWQTMLAWGQNRNRPGRDLNAVLLETASTWARRHTVVARAEVVEKDELFDESDPLADRAFTVGKLTGGYIRDVRPEGHVAVGIGALATMSLVPDELEDAYGGRAPLSGMVFVRAKLR